MSWLWLICTAVIAAVIGFFVGWRKAIISMQPVFEQSISQLNRNLTTDRNFLLCVLRRELANWMFRRDPDRYLQIYKKAHEEIAKIHATDRNDQIARLTKLAAKYPYYSDFDLLGTRDYVLYADAMTMNSYEEVEIHYTSIMQFQALQVATNKNWSETYPEVHTTSDKELVHLEEYVRRYKDTLLKNRIKIAILEFYNYRNNAKDNNLSYKTATFSVEPVPHFADTRYGIHFNDTNEFGLYAAFYGDRAEPYIHYYRSNEKFNQEIMLDDILVDE